MGIALSAIVIKNVTIVKNTGTSVNLNWEAPSDKRKIKWIYGIYYGLTADDILESMIDGIIFQNSNLIWVYFSRTTV